MANMEDKATVTDVLSIRMAINRKLPDVINEIMASFNVNGRSNNGSPVLFLICEIFDKISASIWKTVSEHDTLAVLELFVLHGVDLTAKSNDGEDLKSFAERKKWFGVKKMAEELEKIAKGDKETLEGKFAQFRKELLFTTVRERSLQEIKFLVEQGFQISDTQKFGNTILQVAVERGALNIVQYLVNQGADLAVKDDVEDTLPHLACQYGHVDILKYLVQQGADITVRNKRGRTLQYYACQHGNLNVLEYLDANGADLKVVDEEGSTLQHGATICGNVEILKYLVEHGANVRVKNDYEKSLQHYAAEYGRLNILEYLVEEHQVNVTKSRDLVGQTPLHFAVAGMQLDCAKYLVDNGANPKTKDYGGLRPSPVSRCRFMVRRMKKCLQGKA